MRILIIEDDSSIRNILRMSLEAESFTVDEAEDGEVGSYLARTNQYDLVILDNVLPKKQGKQVCKEIREAGKNMPVLMLSVKSEVLEKVDLLNSGVDDYMTKPFSFEELVARIHTLLRRPTKLEEAIIKVRSIQLDVEKREVRNKDRYLNLTRKEFSLLEILMKNKEKAISRGYIMEHVWDINADPFSNTIEAHILNLRRKIGDKNKNIIKSVPGRGYKITETL